MEIQPIIDSIQSKKTKSILMSVFDKRIRAIIAIMVIILGFAFFSALLVLNITEPKKEILVFILGQVSGYISLILAYFFGSSEEKPTTDQHHQLKEIEE